MDASGSFHHVGSAGRSCGGQTETEDRSSASVRSPLLQVVGNLEAITMVSVSALAVHSRLILRIFLPFGGFNLKGIFPKINPQPFGTGL
jgi:hypothetical protein